MQEIKMFLIKDWPDTDIHKEIIPKRILPTTGGKDEGVGLIGELSFDKLLHPSAHYF